MARLIGIGLVIVAAMLWGTTGTIQALLPPEREPLVVAALRAAIGAAALIVLAGLSPRARGALGALPLVPIVGAGVAIAGYNAMFFAAVTGAGVGIGTALAIGSGPIWVMLWDLSRGRRPTGVRLLGQAICILGAVLLAVAGSAVDATIWGIALALAAGAAYAAYSLLTASVPRQAPATATAAATFTVAALVLAPILAVLPVRWAVAPDVWPLLLFLGVAVTGLSYVCYTLGLQRVTASTAVTLALAEPLTAWGLATLVVGEPNTLLKTVGALLLLAGLAVVIAAPAPRR